MNRYRLLALHIVLGVLATNYSVLVTAWGIGAFAYFLFSTIKNRNNQNQALVGAVYLSCIEMWLRTGKAALPWEFGKLSVLALLFAGMLADGKPRKYPWRFGWMLFFLIPSIIIGSAQSFEELRQNLTFQLGGLIVLIVSLFYCYKRPFSSAETEKMFQFAIYPIVTSLAFLIFHNPVGDIQFGLIANFKASGGFGPNQVSTTLGVGIFLIALRFILKWPPVFSKPVDWLLIIAFTFRGLITLSRGGFVTVMITLFLTYLLYLIAERKWSVRHLVSMLGIACVVFLVGFYVNKLTGNNLLLRFEGETGTTLTGEESNSVFKATSGRSEIIKTDLQIFNDYPVFGCGLGISNTIRSDYGYDNISHTEQTRLLAEHGFFGLFFLIAMCTIPIRHFFRETGFSRYLFFAFTLFSFITMLHSATRLSMVGLFYGIGFLSFPNAAVTLFRKQG